MGLIDFKKNVLELKDCLDTLEKKGIPVRADVSLKVYNFEGNRNDYYRTLFASALKKVQGSIKELQKLILFDVSNEPVVRELAGLIRNLDKEGIKEGIAGILALIESLKTPKLERIAFFSDKIPNDIKDELTADLNEIERCYNAGCYRSAVILCGRILEIALHRRYYEITSVDVLEKSPGTGLGNLIAKMKEKGINLDPAITQQIHLINQVRVFSVHKKQEAFVPSKNQAQAVILYACDLLEKLFR